MEKQDTTLRDALDLLQRGLMTSLLVAVAMATVALVITQSVAPTFETSVQLLATEDEATIEGIGASLVAAPPVDASAYGAAVESEPVRDSARELTGRPELFEAVDVEVEVVEDRVSSLVNITTIGTDRELVAAAADALAAALVTWDERRAAQLVTMTSARISDQIAALDEQIAGLSERNLEAEAGQLASLEALRLERLTDLRVAQSYANSGVAAISQIEPAPIPLEPTGPNPLRNAIIAFLLGLFMSYGVLSLRNALDTRIKTSDDLAKLSGFPILTELPKRAVRTKALLQEAISYLHTNILFAAPNTSPRVILVTSGRNTDDKSNVALNLAKSFARSEKSVLLIDADLRSPAIATRLKLTDTSYPSLQLYLENPEEPVQPVPLYMDVANQLEVIPTFQPALSPTELLRVGFRPCLERWKTIYDVIVIDSAPLLAVADSLTIAPLCDTLLFSVNVQDTDTKEIEAAVELLGRSNVPVVGFVATEVDVVSQGEVYGYSPVALSGKETAIVPANFDQSRGIS